MSNILNSIIKTVKEKYIFIIYFFLAILLILIIFQYYFYQKQNNIMHTSVKFDETLNITNTSSFISQMQEISKEKNIYGIFASLEIIKNDIKNSNYDDAYKKYEQLLNKKNIDKNYKSIISIHAAYNLIEYLSKEKIIDLINNINNDDVSFKGYKNEILFLLALKENNKTDIKILSEQIMNDALISTSIKERVKKLNEFNKYQ